MPFASGANPNRMMSADPDEREMALSGNVAQILI